MNNNRDIDVIRVMIEKNLIPKVGSFQVTDELINSFYKIYGEIYNSKTINRNNNVRYAKKLAGISLMKLNIKRSEQIKEKRVSISKPDCGIVYLISNPAFPGMYKIGITQDLNKRLDAYQTGDPFRNYKVEHYKFVENRKLEEKKFLKMFKTNLARGEWINSDKVKEVFYS